MGYSVHAPRPGLAAFVESYWVQDEPAVEGAVEPTTILPAGRAALVLDHGDPFEEVHADGTRTRLAPVLLAAQRLAPARVAASGRTALVIVNFRPCGAAALLGSQAEQLGRFVDAGGAFAERAVVRLREELAGEPDAAARVAAVERFLLDARPPAAPDALTAAAVARIEARGGREDVGALCAALGVGRRRLARAFEREVGIPPKALARIVRFQHALRRARAGRPWADAAAAAGYHDQAHLVHECVALTGRPPTALLPRLAERALGRAFNDSDPRLARFATYL